MLVLISLNIHLRGQGAMQSRGQGTKGPEGQIPRGQGQGSWCQGPDQLGPRVRAEPGYRGEARGSKLEDGGYYIIFNYLIDYSHY